MRVEGHKYMTDKLDGAEKHFEALTKAADDVEKSRKRHAHLLTAFLEAVEKNPSGWQFEIVQHGRTVAEGPLNKQVQAIFGALGHSLQGIRPGEGAGCPEKVGCTNIGQLGDICFYLCKKAELGRAHTVG